ncbi:MAG: helix-turn-helix domain-containing protein [Acidimicrobiales bacterium]
MAYEERATAVGGAVLWRQAVDDALGARRILPDGCLDLIWDGQRLLVAGPDTAARWHHTPPGTVFVGLRLSCGLGPALLGIPADQLVDEYPDLDQVWAPAPVRALTEQAAADPESALEQWAVKSAAHRPADPLGGRVQTMAAAGVSVADMADRTGYSSRQLHRRCLALFGYGPRHLARILRLGRALDEARAGRPLADVAAWCGYVDQAHMTHDVRALTGATPTTLLEAAVTG